ncbi:MAG: DNA polymerase III subunit delta [Pseudomonadales bacterium]|nr:DNA polymerase III subunit delta [Pseudomonadales bacterium]
MKLDLQQLPAHLQKSLQPIYLICGDETLLVDEACDQIRDTAKQNGYDDRQIHQVDAQFDWQQLMVATGTLSLFSQKRTVELRLAPKQPGNDGRAALQNYAENPNPDDLWLIRCGKLEKSTQKTKWFKAVEKAGVVMVIQPVNPNQLPNWIRQRMQIAGLKPTAEAVQMLADQVEGNLLAASQEIEKIQLLAETPVVNGEMITEMVTNNARYSVFTLVDRTLDGQTESALRVLHGLRAESSEPQLVIWALAREIRLLIELASCLQNQRPASEFFRMQKPPIWESRQRSIQQRQQRIPLPRLQTSLKRLLLIDKITKGAAKGNAWEEIERLLLSLATR